MLGSGPGGIPGNRLGRVLLGGPSLVLALVSRHNVELRAETKRTEAKAEEARRNYQEARSAIQKMLGLASDSGLNDTPKVLRLRRDLQEEARGFYDRVLAKIEATDPVIQSDTAGAFAEASMLESFLGNSEKAETLIRRGLGMIEHARAQRPDSFEYLGTHVSCLLRLTSLLASKGQTDQAVDMGRETAGMAELLVRAKPDDPSQQDFQAVCLEMLGNALRASKHRKTRMSSIVRQSRFARRLIRLGSLA